MSTRARTLLVAMTALFFAAAAGVAWYLIDRSVGVPDRPDTYDVTGPQPGDLAPGLDIEDNVRNYGLDHDLRYRFRTNSLGFRGPEPAANGGPVVLILGDSFAFGMGTDEGETFPDHLRKQLARTHPRVVVHNAAIPGYTITDQIEQWQAKLSKLQVDLVLVCHTASDLKEMARPTSFRRLMKHDDASDIMNDADVAAVVARAGGDKAEATRRFYTFTQEMLLKRFGASAPAELIRLRERYAEGIIELAGKSRLGVIIWANGYGMAGLHTGPLTRRLGAAGVPLFEGDVAMRSQGEVPVERLYLPDKHFSATGNALAARQTAPWVVGLLR